jgi:SAM-dependent methyltransferase
MDNSETPQFDAYSQVYSDLVDKSVRFSGQSTEFFHRVKIDALLRLVMKYLTPKEATIADVGCGTGSLSGLLIPHVKAVFGTDISSACVERAQRRIRGGQFKVYDGTTLPYEQNSVDLAMTSCVMHHVPPANWKSFTLEMSRIVRPGGLVAVLEHNPWNPLTRFAVSTCEFDKDAVLLSRGQTKKLMQDAGLEIIEQVFILFFPWDLAFLRRVEQRLVAIPLGAQYIVIGRKPRQIDC